MSVLVRCATAGLAVGLVLTTVAGIWAARAGRQLLATGLGGAALLLFLLGWLLVLHGGLEPAAPPGPAGGHRAGGRGRR